MTQIVTVEPFDPLAPAVGDCFHTCPRLDFQLEPSFSVMILARKPAFCNVDWAAERDMPMTVGTPLVLGPVDTTIATVIPSAAVAPPAGVCERTRPGA